LSTKYVGNALMDYGKNKQKEHERTSERKYEEKKNGRK
jgi:hypothetical protein